MNFPNRAAPLSEDVFIVSFPLSQFSAVSFCITRDIVTTITKKTAAMEQA